ncbi:CD40 ligand [Brachyhypopomus gauderio]|uniref:CD40 ligand n=1 Tax=Brachyhypopomus gauderio TaxID=698409 RepID=UPI0040436063
MINTFHTSFGPPPIPPRQGHRGSPQVTNTPLVKFLSVMLLLLMLLTFGGFLYLFSRLHTLQERSGGVDTLRTLQQCLEQSTSPEDLQRCKTMAQSYKDYQAEGKVSFLAGTAPPTVPNAMMVLSDENKFNQMRTLIWDQEHSVKEKINLGTSGALSIQIPGYYFLQSQVTFSKRHMKVPLSQIIWTRIPKLDKGTGNWDEKTLLQAYCSLSQDSSVPNMCTASQSGVFRLEKHQQLFVNVTDRSLVNVDSSTFRLFKLQD